MGGDGFSDDESSDDETIGYPERGIQPPAPDTEWAHFLKDSGYIIIMENEGRHNVAVATHPTKQLFAKVERVSNTYVKEVESCLESWVNIGKIANCVRLFNFKLTDDNKYAVLIMERAPGIIMSKVVADFFRKYIGFQEGKHWDDSTLSYPASLPDGRKKLVDYEMLRLQACNSVYKKTKFYQLDWKADNMFYDSNTESITLIDMPFAAFNVTNPELYNDQYDKQRAALRLTLSFSWWTDDKTAAAIFERRREDNKICKAFVASWAVRNMTEHEVRQTRFNTPQHDLDLFMKLVPDFLKLWWPEFREKTVDDITTAYIGRVSRARVAHGSAVQRAQDMRDTTIQDAMLAATKTYDTAIELAGITHRQAKQIAHADRTRELYEQDKMIGKIAAVFNTFHGSYSIETARTKLNYGRPKSHGTQHPFTDYLSK